MAAAGRDRLQSRRAVVRDAGKTFGPLRHQRRRGRLRKGRRYAVARRLSGLFASYVRQRPLLVDWLEGRPGDLDSDLTWQPELWRALVAVVPADPTSVTGRPSPGCEGPADLPSRLSLFGHTRLACTDIELLDALAAHHDLHLWLPHPSDELWQALAGLHGAIPAATTPATAW